MTSSKIKNLYGLYIHIPFCTTKCLYCNFYSISDLSKVNEYFIALNIELEFYKYKHHNVDTIYFGGGTPSIVHFSYIYKTLETIYKVFSVTPNPEITIEMNPSSAKYQKLKKYYLAGINRLSIGVQSMCSQTLTFLGRTHNRSEIFKIISWARDIGFKNIGVDLIYGIPGQSISMWQQEIMEILKIEPEHISCYLLDVDLKTPIGNKIIKGEIIPLNENTLVSMFEFTIKFLSSFNYSRYETSNFSKKLLYKEKNQYISKHNIKYWNFDNYLGFGPSAHSYNGKTRQWNYSCLERYVDDLTNKKILSISGQETLTFDQQVMEFIYLGLRQNKGISVKSFKERFSIDIFSLFGKSILILIEDSFITVDKNKIKLTNKGMPILDSIVSWICL